MGTSHELAQKLLLMTRLSPALEDYVFEDQEMHGKSKGPCHANWLLATNPEELERTATRYRL